MSSKLHVKKDDTVLILSGEDRGKTGKVIVEGRNMVKKHVKPKKMGDPGGIVDAEGAIYACKVQVVCPACKKPARVGHKLLADGTKQRICKRCGEAL